MNFKFVIISYVSHLVFCTEPHVHATLLLCIVYYNFVAVMYKLYIDILNIKHMALLWYESMIWAEKALKILHIGIREVLTTIENIMKYRVLYTIS